VLGVRRPRVEQLQHFVGRVLLAQLEHADRVVDGRPHQVEHLADLREGAPRYRTVARAVGVSR
jgi:hypothetical protein